MGNGCGLQMDGFSSHFEPSESISVDFYDFAHFAIDFGGLVLVSEGPGTFAIALMVQGSRDTVRMGYGCLTLLPAGPRTL